MGLVVDYTISVGNIIQILTIIGGGLIVLIVLKTDVSSLKSGAATLRDDFSDLQTEFKKFGEILVKLADIRGEIRVIDARVTMAEQDIRELKHGDGFIKGPRGIDREY